MDWERPVCFPQKPNHAGGKVSSSAIWWANSYTTARPLRQSRYLLIKSIIGYTLEHQRLLRVIFIDVLNVPGSFPSRQKLREPDHRRISGPDSAVYPEICSNLLIHPASWIILLAHTTEFQGFDKLLPESIWKNKFRKKSSSTATKVWLWLESGKRGTSYSGTMKPKDRLKKMDPKT